MRFEDYAFGRITIDGVTYEHDVILDRGEIRKRKKGASKPLRASYGHTPLSAQENIPWRCRRLVVGTGAAGALPIVREVEVEARRRDVELLTMPTSEAVAVLNEGRDDTNAVLHLTC